MDIPRMLSWTYIVCFFKEGLFVYFWLPRVLLAARRLFVVAAGKVPLHCGGRASRCWRLLAEKLGLQGPQSPECRLSSRGTWALLLHGIWDLPVSGIGPVFPAPADGFFNTGPSGKCSSCVLYQFSLFTSREFGHFFIR